MAREAAARPDAPYIVFCGVHFMAESADILTSHEQTVILPDLAAGCSMADMAQISQVEDAWADLQAAGVADATVPVTYMNSSAAIKGFTGRHGGTICTSSNAKTALTWAFAQRRGSEGKVLFLPDQHLGRNTYVRDLGGRLEECVVFDPHKPGGGLSPQQLREARMILWRGHCSVHGRFSVEAVETARHNAQKLGLGARAAFVECAYTSALTGPFDLIVSNPPYIPSQDILSLAVDVRGHDPHIALDGGRDGLDAYRAIAPAASGLLGPGGALIFEVGQGQDGAVRNIMRAARLAAEDPPRRDLAGVNRCVIGRKMPVNMQF